MAEAESTTPASETVEHETPCIRCGYELLGLEKQSVCPECGLRVAESLERRRLGMAAPGYLSSLRHGITLSLLGLTLQIILGFAALLRARPAFISNADYLVEFGEPAAALLLVVGVWLLTVPDPGLPASDQSLPNKRVMRAAAALLTIVQAGSTALSLGFALRWASALPIGALPLAAAFIGICRSMAEFAAWLTLATGLANYARWLAARIPDEGLFSGARSIGRVIPWMLVLALGASIVFGPATRVLPLGLMIWLLWWLRGRIGRGAM
jgi:hypothetical protein